MRTNNDDVGSGYDDADAAAPRLLRPTATTWKWSEQKSKHSTSSTEMLFIFPRIRAGWLAGLLVPGGGGCCSGFGPDAFEREMHLRRTDDGIRFQEIGEGRRWGWMDGWQPKPVHKTVSGCALCYKLLIFVPLRFILTIGLVVVALGVSQKEFPEAWKIYCHLGFSKS